MNPPATVLSATLLVLSLPSAYTAPVMTTVLNPTADARIVTYDQNANEGANYYLAVYTHPEYDNIQRTLIQFDLSSLPKGQTVVSASLNLYFNAILHYGGNPDGQPMEVYRVTQPWTELEASWLNRDAAVPWSTPGGDYAGTSGFPDVNPYASNSDVIPDYPFPDAQGNPVIPPGWPSEINLSWDVTGLAREWYTGAAANDGLLLRSYPGNSLHFGSRESAWSGLSVPQLVIETTNVPEPGATAIVSGFGLVALSLVRRMSINRVRDVARHHQHAAAD